MLSCEQIVMDYKLKYETLANVVPVGLVLLNLAGEILEVNQKALDMLRIVSKSFKKEVNIISHSPFSEVDIPVLILNCIDSKQTQSKIVRFYSCDNIPLCLKITACPVLDVTQNVCYVLLVCEDLSEIDVLKEKYWKIARTMAAIVDGIKSHYIFAKDKDGVFQVVNEAYADMFGVSPLDIVGKKDADLFPPELCEKYARDDQEVLSSCGLLETEEEVFNPKYNQNRHWRTFKTAVCDESGNGVVLVGIGEDIEDRYQMRKSAAKAIVELEAFVKRTKKQKGGRKC
jgi:PAS domain S-box-containing protein